eukprot:1155302-Pelagomonas_calceolata.AAC.1
MASQNTCAFICAMLDWLHKPALPFLSGSDTRLALIYQSTPALPLGYTLQQPLIGIPDEDPDLSKHPCATFGIHPAATPHWDP